MTTTIGSNRDWTYRAAQLRLQQAGQTRLPSHLAGVQLDLAGNRVVECQCGWRGNGLGWLAHVDQVIGEAVRD
ncbi:MAG: hypothetical protein ACRDJ9_05460 [Dehalococcoidia bacterium]